MDFMLLLLSVAGGSVDAMNILGFGILTAAQTGNTILLAVSFALGEFAIAFYSGVSVVAYMIGAAAGEIIVVKRHRDPGLWPVVWTLLAELAPLICFLVLWHLAGHAPATAVAAVLVALSAVSMGMQSAAVKRLHLGPATTYITGTLTTFMTETIRSFSVVQAARPQTYGTHDPSRAQQSPQEQRNHPFIYGLSWVVYAGGAVAGAMLYLKFEEIALILPIATIVTVIIAGVRHA
jgi:uncharacterized membrane protein YoaK (UPF0700 family)